MQIGDRVYYNPKWGLKENGIIKSFNDDKTIAFVVYHCANDWDNYKNYTGASTKISDIQSGWVNSDGSIMEEYCDHEYRYDACKWQPIDRMSCINCGKIIND